MTHETAAIDVEMEEQSIVYAVIVEKPTENLTSEQIIDGVNADNTPLIPQHIASGTTNKKGKITLDFSLLLG